MFPRKTCRRCRRGRRSVLGVSGLSGVHFLSPLASSRLSLPATSAAITGSGLTLNDQSSRRLSHRPVEDFTSCLCESVQARQERLLQGLLIKTSERERKKEEKEKEEEDGEGEEETAEAAAARNFVRILRADYLLMPSETRITAWC